MLYVRVGCMVAHNKFAHKFTRRFGPYTKAIEKAESLITYTSSHEIDDNIESLTCTDGSSDSGCGRVCSYFWGAATRESVT